MIADREPTESESESGEPATEPAPPPSTSDPASGDKKAKRKQLPVCQETILLLGVALVFAVLIKALLVQAFYIPSESMEPGLVKNDRILVQKVSYWGSGGPQRGDVIVFEDPGGWLGSDTPGPTSLLARGLAKVGLYPTGGHLVKRVIGVAGDEVTCCDDQGRLSVNGYALDETEYVAQDGTDCAAPGTKPRCKLDVGPIPDGYLLVMGDNRANSADSTVRLSCDLQAGEDCPPTQGLVPVGNVVGKVLALVWPRDRFDRITRPDVFEHIPDSP